MKGVYKNDKSKYRLEGLCRAFKKMGSFFSEASVRITRK
jgi:hypothetical protein